MINHNVVLNVVGEVDYVGDDDGVTGAVNSFPRFSIKNFEFKIAQPLPKPTEFDRSTSLQQSFKGSCSLLVSGHNLRADCQWRTLVPPLNSGANAAHASVLALM